MTGLELFWFACTIGAWAKDLPFWIRLVIILPLVIIYAKLRGDF